MAHWKLFKITIGNSLKYIFSIPINLLISPSSVDGSVSQYNMTGEGGNQLDFF